MWTYDLVRKRFGLAAQSIPGIGTAEEPRRQAGIDPWLSWVAVKELKLRDYDYPPIMENQMEKKMENEMETQLAFLLM